jgi:hypothetical protein
VSIAWEPKKYYDYFDKDPSQNLSNSAYWYFSDNYFSANFYSKNEPIERLFVSSEDTSLILKEYEELFSLKKILDVDIYWIAYTYSPQKMLWEPNKITWVHINQYELISH